MTSTLTTTADTSSDTRNLIPKQDGDLPSLPPTQAILAEAISMTNIERFFHLLHHTKALISHHGPYTTLPHTTVFSRALHPPQPTQRSSPTLLSLATTLSSAQDCTYTAQPPGPPNSDLDLFTLLWDSSVAVLEEILARGSLPGESFGWGIFGLSAGYMHPPAHDPPARTTFLRNKARLHDALCLLPSLEGSNRNRNEYVLRGKRPTTTAQLTRARRDVHTLGHILLHEFRKGGWRRVRWVFVVKVAERWVGAFGRGPVVEVGERGVEKKRGVDAKKENESEGKHVTFTFP